MVVYECEDPVINTGIGCSSIGRLTRYSTRNELLKLPVFTIKYKALMSICISWINRHIIIGKRRIASLMPF